MLNERVISAVRELAGNPTMNGLQVVEWLEARVDEKRRREMTPGRLSMTPEPDVAKALATAERAVRQRDLCILMLEEKGQPDTETIRLLHAAEKNRAEVVH